MSSQPGPNDLAPSAVDAGPQTPATGIVDNGSTANNDLTAAAVSRGISSTQPLMCNQVPAYADQDNFVLSTTDNTGTFGGGLVVTLQATAVVGKAYPLRFVDLENEASLGATSDGSSIEHGPGPGATPPEVALSVSPATARAMDPQPLTTAAVTVLTIPHADGEPLTARIRLGFADGKDLDVTLRGLSPVTQPLLCSGTSAAMR